MKATLLILLNIVVVIFVWGLDALLFLAAVGMASIGHPWTSVLWFATTAFCAAVNVDTTRLAISNIRYTSDCA